jgi:hypothetical protein
VVRRVSETPCVRDEGVVPWLRRLVADLSPRRTMFSRKPVPVRFVADKVALARGFLPVLPLSPVGPVAPLLRVHLWRGLGNGQRLQITHLERIRSLGE